MWNKWIYLICLMIIALSVCSCNYASNEMDILNDTINTNYIEVSSVDLEQGKYNNVNINDVNSLNNISIYYGERFNIDWENDVHCNCTVFIDNKNVSFISDLNQDKTINMYNYNYFNKNFINSIYPNVGLHNISVLFEFDTPKKYDVTIESYKTEINFDYENADTVLMFHFTSNNYTNAKKIYSYNTTFNILKKEKTVYITNISSFASYINPLFYNVIVDNPENSFFIFISNNTGIVKYDSSFGVNKSYFFDEMKHEIKPGIYNLTIVNEYDNTFDSASFTLYNDININTVYTIKDNDVILKIELFCEYNTPLNFSMYKIINETAYNYRFITKEILSNGNNHKFNFEIIFNNVDNNYYEVSISDYWSIIDVIYFTVNKTYVNEDENIENFTDVNKNINVSNRNFSKNYIIDTININGSTIVNLDLKENNTIFNSNYTHKSNVRHDNLEKIVSEFGDSFRSDDSISGRNDVNSYEIYEKSSSKSSSNIFTSLRIIFFLLIAFVVGFLKFKNK